MASVFRLDDNYVDKPKRNTFDLSSQNNLTLKMGRLVPVLCKEVLPGDSFKIDPSFGLRYLPQKFPVQTRQRASVKYYYVRNRNLWTDWMDFIGKTKSGLTPPYINFGYDENKYLCPSSIADYMGVPIYVRSSSKEGAKQVLRAAQPNFVKGNNFLYVPNGSSVYTNKQDDNFAIHTKKYIAQSFYQMQGSSQAMILPLKYLYGAAYGNDLIPLPEAATNTNLMRALSSPVYQSSDKVYLSLYRKPLVVGGEGFTVTTSDSRTYVILRATNGTDYLYPVVSGQTIPLSFSVYEFNESTGQLDSIPVTLESVIGLLINKSGALTNYPTVDMTIRLDANEGLCWCDVAYEDWPFSNAYNEEGVRLSALPFRAIEAIYNALIRNAENNPFYIRGVAEYNKYNETLNGGASNAYNLLEDYHANWADDRFTTALPSPQQGNAPLVGLTGVQGATLTTSTEDGTTSTLHLQVDSDTGNVMLVDGVSSDSPEYLNDAMMSAIEYGITINDLRNVNAFQRWLENNIRRGYKYKDQLMSHYGVSARYDVLDMPEFIGGISRDVDVQQVTQTTQNEYGNLGEYAGQSSIFGQGHSIEKYCDEHGFIIGIMCVYPMPVYQDTLPKYLVKQDPFDYYFPEFGKIGPQPISKKELSFSQSYLEGNSDETFGYQRAWYDYLESLDEVHGLYHTDFRNFLIARDFMQVPTLGSNFLTIDSDDVNNTFYSDDDKDKILGQVYHKCSVKRAIPLIGIPSLE